MIRLSGKMFLALVWLAAFAAVASPQEDEPLVFQVKAVYRNADLNYQAIDRYQKRAADWSDTGKVVHLFKPVKGKYKVILFMATGYGLLAHNDEKDIFHNILILKVNQKNEILDGLEYVLEWAEPPFAVRLFRTAKRGVRLKKGLPLSELDFKPIEEGFRWTPTGVIDNLYDFKEIF